MSWLAFIASIVGSTAWPAVVLVLAFALRKHLGPLVRRLDELTLPGGAKAKFNKELDQARRDAEHLVIEAPLQRIENDASSHVQLSDQDFWELAYKYPEAAILKAYKEVEDVALEYNNIFNDSTLSFNQIITALSKHGLIDDNGLELFYKLRSARNSAAHSGTASITAGEAIQYRQLCRTIIDLLHHSFFSLRESLPPRP
jgi:hypothetical protein